jgi:hypothetical protein
MKSQRNLAFFVCEDFSCSRGLSGEEPPEDGIRIFYILDFLRNHFLYQIEFSIFVLTNKNKGYEIFRNRRCTWN